MGILVFNDTEKVNCNNKSLLSKYEEKINELISLDEVLDYSYEYRIEPSQKNKQRIITRLKPLWMCLFLNYNGDNKSAVTSFQILYDKGYRFVEELPSTIQDNISQPVFESSDNLFFNYSVISEKEFISTYGLPLLFRQCVTASEENVKAMCEILNNQENDPNLQHRYLLELSGYVGSKTETRKEERELTSNIVNNIATRIPNVYSSFKDYLSMCAGENLESDSMVSGQLYKLIKAYYKG